MKEKKLTWLCETCLNFWQVETGEGREKVSCLKNPRFDMENNDIVVSCTRYEFDKPCE
jgi:hypothetical protein